VRMCGRFGRKGWRGRFRGIRMLRKGLCRCRSDGSTRGRKRYPFRGHVPFCNTPRRARAEVLRNGMTQRFIRSAQQDYSAEMLSRIQPSSHSKIRALQKTAQFDAHRISRAVAQTSALHKSWTHAAIYPTAPRCATARHQKTSPGPCVATVLAWSP